MIFSDLANMRPLNKCGFFFKEVTVLLVFGILVPTSDNFSDWALTYELLQEKEFYKCTNGAEIPAKYANSWNSCENGYERE